MKRIITAIIASILVVMTAATLSGCKNKSVPSTGTQIYKYAASEDSSDTQPYKVSFKFGDSSKKISEIWVNIDKLNIETTFEVNGTYSSSWDTRSSYKTFTSRSITKAEVKEAKKADGWIALGFDSKWSSLSAIQYVSIGIVGECRVNEIVFVDTDGKRITVELNMVEYWRKSDNENLKYELVTDKDDDKDDKTSPKFLIDEQEKFDVRTKND